jgi:MGT family glycosyltransferase
MSRVLIYTSPAKGHLTPVTAAAVELADRGHTVHVRTMADEVEGIRALGLEASAIDQRIEDRELDDWKATTTMAALKRSMRTFADRAAYEVEDLRSAIGAFSPDSLVIDTNTWGAQAAAEASALPWAMFQPYFTPLPATGVPPFGPGLPRMTGPLGLLRDGLLGKAITGTLASLMLPPVNDVRSSLGLSSVESLGAALTRAPLVLYFTVPELDYPRDEWPNSYRFVGPGDARDAQPPRWLDDVERPIVLVTCSTERQDDRTLIQTSLDALPTAGYFVIATTGSHDPAGFGGAADRTVVKRFLSHGPVLPRAAVVVCHGGMGITQRALASGVPVVVVPFGRDQLEVARRVEHAGVGVRLPRRRLTPEALTAAVRRASALSENAGRMAEHIAETGGGRSAADAVEALIKARGIETVTEDDQR